MRRKEKGGAEKRKGGAEKRKLCTLGPLYMAYFLVGKSQKMYNRPVELCFLSLSDLTLIGSATFCLILKLSCVLIHR